MTAHEVLSTKGSRALLMACKQVWSETGLFILLLAQGTQREDVFCACQYCAFCACSWHPHGLGSDKTHTRKNARAAHTLTQAHTNFTHVHSTASQQAHGFWGALLTEKGQLNSSFSFEMSKPSMSFSVIKSSCDGTTFSSNRFYFSSLFSQWSKLNAHLKYIKILKFWVFLKEAKNWRYGSSEFMCPMWEGVRPMYYDI